MSADAVSRSENPGKRQGRYEAVVASAYRSAIRDSLFPVRGLRSRACSQYRG
jgi:hypothetical protein